MAMWAGAAFELRLGVEFCVYILTGELAGLAPGAARCVQLQAPQAVDDLVLEFDSGATWAVQAKAGPSLRLEWNPERPFGKALRQLYAGATEGQIDLSAESLDRLELAADHRAPASITAFGAWLAKARRHYRWQAFATASSGKEREMVEKLPVLLGAEPGDELLRFLKKLHLRRSAPPDEWWSQLRGRLIVTGVPDNVAADQILAVLGQQVADVAPYAGQLDSQALRRACRGLPGLPRLGAPPFQLLREPTEGDLYRMLKMPAVRPAHFVARPELAGALDSGEGVLVAGRPGSGKSHALIKLALAQPGWPVAVVARGFRAGDLGRLSATLRRVQGPYQLLWDDVHEDPKLFVDAVQRLAERGDRLRVLAAYREQHRAAVAERVTPEFCRRAGIGTEPLRLRAFDGGQAAEMAASVAKALELELDSAALTAYAMHVQEGDGGPLFALSAGLLLREREQETGQPVRAAQVDHLPQEMLSVWRHLCERLAERPGGFARQSLLGVLRFLRGIACPLDVRLAELLYRKVLERSRGDFEDSAHALAREGWLRRDGDEFAAHDVTLEAVPEREGRWTHFVGFAQKDIQGEELRLGLLRGTLADFFWHQTPRTRTVEERHTVLTLADSLGRLAVAAFRSAGHNAYLAAALNNTSNYSLDLAGLQDSQQGHSRLLQGALGAIEEAVSLYRDLGLQAELAMSLNSASNCYGELAELQDSRQGRSGLLERARSALREAIILFRDLGLQADLAIALNNASVRCRDLAALQDSREECAVLLHVALDASEEAIFLCRRLGRQADLAMALNSYSGTYYAQAGLQDSQAARVLLLQQALNAIKESVSIDRKLGLQAGLARSLCNTSILYGDLAELQDSREDRAHLVQLALDDSEEAISLFRDLGLLAELASTLNSASVQYNSLAGLQDLPQDRARPLRRALGASKEAARIRRELGLQADLAMSLENASNHYSGLAILEDSRLARADLLQQALIATEEAVSIYRDLGLQAELASSLSTASLLYRELAGLQDAQRGYASPLQQARARIEEAVSLCRDLDLQVDLAISLGRATHIYKAMAEAAQDRRERVAWLRQALESIEEAIVRFRDAGIVVDLIQALSDAIFCHVMLEEGSGELDVQRVQDLCREGEALCEPMGDLERLVLFRDVRQQLEEEG
jgi:hypothetical protein